MSEFKIEDKVHYFNYVKSILGKKNINIFNCDYNELRSFCDRIFEFSKLYEDKIRRNDLKTPAEAFTFLLYKGAKIESDVFRVRNIIDIFMTGYKSLVSEENVDREKYRRLYEQFYLPSPEKLEQLKEQKNISEFERKIEQLRRVLEDRSKYLKARGLEYSREFISEAEKLIGDTGIYVFYGSDKKTVFYVGKSTSSLGERMGSSSRERNGIFYFSYALTSNGNEASIYEMYYIAKFQPILNVDGNYGGEINIELPELEFSEIKPLYNTIEK
jgi:hypothetical protein